MGYSLRLIGLWSLLSETLRERSGGRIYLKSWSTHDISLGELYGDVYMEVWVDDDSIGQMSILPKETINLHRSMEKVLNDPVFQVPHRRISVKDDTLVIFPETNYNVGGSDKIWKKLNLSRFSDIYLDTENTDYPWKFEGYQNEDLATVAVIPLGKASSVEERHESIVEALCSLIS